MKKITWLIVGVALVALLIGAYYQTTQTIDNTTHVERQSLNEALQESLSEYYAPHLVDAEDTP